jgi:hypothetical protein
MAEAVYVMCAFTALVCALLLLRAYARTRTPLLLWAGICFTGLTANNVLLYVDRVVIPDVDLSVLRGAIALAGFVVLVCGLVWEGR